MPNERQKVEVIRFTEGQMIQMAGIAERSIHISDRFRKSIQMVFNTDGLVVRVDAERHLHDLAGQFNKLADDTSKVYQQIVESGELVTEDVLSDVEKFFGSNEGAE